MSTLRSEAHATAPLRWLLAGLCVVLLSGCTGTRITRSSGPDDRAQTAPHAMFGGYPFQAVVVDYQIEAASRNEGNSYVVLGSLIIDLVVDTVLLPIDLVAWAFGYHKRGLESGRTGSRPY